MIKAYFVSIAFFIAAGSAWSDTYPPLRSDLKIPTIVVIDETNQVRSLPSDWADQRDGPLLLLPVYTRCEASCPVMIQALRNALTAYDSTKNSFKYRVLVFSFDARDTNASLREFRVKQKIPPEWTMVRSSDQGAIRKFFDEFNFTIMTTGGEFAHPNEGFVFNRDLRWEGTLFGAKITADEIDSIFKSARNSESRSMSARARIWAAHPESWIILGTLGFLVSLSILFRIVFKKRENFVSTEI